MSPPNERERAFVEYLRRLAAAEDRGALAALRRGLGLPPGDAADMHPYVVPWLPREAAPWEEDPYYLVATLFAWHPVDAGEEGPQDLGASFARLQERTGGEAVERRFVGLLDCHREDLPEHLRHAVGLLRSHEVPVPWAQLLHDIRGWDWDGRPVQRQWARSFWGARRESSELRQVEPTGGENHVS